ncbi:MAG TPA: lytic transglycosylase domain-containing protein [Pseudoneobacillus sp.]|nr:lytic transglycosylase domain-containing protein [Pseudoneobacillus sp.]
MNVDKLKAMLELKALQNFQSSSSSSSNSTLFQDLMNELLTENEITALTEPLPSEQKATTAPIFNSYIHPFNLKESKMGNAEINKIIEEAAGEYNIPSKLIRSVIQQESNFNPNAVSGAGASGLMQLMPETAKGLGVQNIFDVRQNIFGGSKYLRQMLDRYDGDIQLALAAYNSGPGNVDRHGGIPPFRETQNYVKKITEHYYS